MKTAEEWLKEYSATHRNPINKRIHTVCVPAILFSVLGGAWHLPFGSFPWMNGGILLSVLALLFYASLGFRPFLVMLATLGAMILAIAALEWGTSLPMLSIYGAIFLVAWIGQFIGHHYEGKSPSFFQDLQFLLIGPLWVYSH